MSVIAFSCSASVSVQSGSSNVVVSDGSNRTVQSRPLPVSDVAWPLPTLFKNDRRGDHGLPRRLSLLNQPRIEAPGPVVLWSFFAVAKIECWVTCRRATSTWRPQWGHSQGADLTSPRQNGHWYRTVGRTAASNNPPTWSAGNHAESSFLSFVSGVISPRRTISSNWLGANGPSSSAADCMNHCAMTDSLTSFECANCDACVLSDARRRSIPQLVSHRRSQAFSGPDGCGRCWQCQSCRSPEFAAPVLGKS
jgi:hypothetical protein